MVVLFPSADIRERAATETFVSPRNGRFDGFRSLIGN